MTIRGTTRLLVLTAAYIFVSGAWAQGGEIPEPELRAEEIPGLLDIEFRCAIPSVPADPNDPEYLAAKAAREAYIDTYDYCALYKPLDIISVTPSVDTLTQNKICTDNLSDQSHRQDGYGIDTARNDRTCDDGIGKGESFEVSIRSNGDGEAAFDVSGIWLTDFIRDKNGESGVITLTLVGETTRTFSFNAKDASSESSDNPNGEFFFDFGEILRMTKAEISGDVGSFSVAGFSQRPIDINTTANSCGDSSCSPELARNVRLELEPVVDPPKPGRKGVTGTLFKEGVYVITDPRGYCKHGVAATDADPVRSLPISITGRRDATTGEPIPDLIMLPHQCGHPTADNPNPVIYILDLDGRDLVIKEDTITAKFDDGKDDPSIPPGYRCDAVDQSLRPGIGWLPKSRISDGQYAEIPVLNAAGGVVFDVQDITVGPCSSSRGSVPRYSYIVYNWVNRVIAANTTPDKVISDRIEQLAAYVDDLFACVQQGVNQSTFSSDVGRISKSFAGARYEQALQYVRDMRANVLDPRLNVEIGEKSGCSFNLAENGGYLKTDATGGTLVPANAVGNLLVQLNHLEWMIFTTYLGLPY